MPKPAQTPVSASTHPLLAHATAEPLCQHLSQAVLDCIQDLLQELDHRVHVDPAPEHAAFAQLVQQPSTHIFEGLLAVMLRLLILLYLEDSAQVPMHVGAYRELWSVTGLYAALTQDTDVQIAAWSRLLTLFRGVYAGVEAGDGPNCVSLPARANVFFDPQQYPFLEGRCGSDAQADATDWHHTPLKTLPIGNAAVLRVLGALCCPQGARLNYAAVPIELFGTIYENVMGYAAMRLDADAICIRQTRYWITGEQMCALPQQERTAWLLHNDVMEKPEARRVGLKLSDAKTPEQALALLAPYAFKGVSRARGQLVCQPTQQRRQTGSHYTPRAMAEPVVQKALMPHFHAYDGQMPSARILDLKICDPAMGCGVFLVLAGQQLAEQLCAAWQREGQYADIAAQHPDVSRYARQLVAGRCLYGVDKNPFAVELGKLTLSLDSFDPDGALTFVEHMCKCGDALIGLDIEQLSRLHWDKTATIYPVVQRYVDVRISQARATRACIARAASTNSPRSRTQKQQMLAQEQKLLEPVDTIGDLVLWAFFAHDTKGKRLAAQKMVARQIVDCMTGGWPKWTEDLLHKAAWARTTLRPFHWHAQFPEAFATLQQAAPKAPHAPNDVDAHRQGPAQSLQRPTHASAH